MKSMVKRAREYLKSTKGSVGNLWNFALGLGILFIIVSVVAIILTTFQGTQTANTYAYNLTGDGLSAMDDFGDWYAILVVAGIAGVVLYLIVRFLVPNLRRGGGYY